MTNRAPAKPSDFPFGRMHEFLVSFCASGGNPEDLQSLIEDRTLMKRALDYVRRGGYEASTSQKRAREIMGKNFLGLEEASEHLKIRFSNKEIKALAEVPYPENLLEALKDTHVLVAGYPLSILEIRSRVPEGFFYKYDPDWYADKKEKFSSEKCRLAWLLIRKDEVSSSTGKSYDEQRALLLLDEEVPRAVEVVYLMTLYFFVRGEKLFEKSWVRTGSLSSGGNRVNVGFYYGRLCVGVWDDDYRSNYLGLASSRKVPNP